MISASYSITGCPIGGTTEKVIIAIRDNGGCWRLRIATGKSFDK
ncbi:MAG: hypothetical protein ACLU80_16275 [Dorea sp.]